MQLIVAPVLLVLRIIAAMMFAACLGALTATVVSLFTVGERPDWLGALTMFAIALAVVFGAGSFGMSRLMPAAAELSRQRGRDREASVPTAFVLLLTALVGVGVLQIPAFVAWWVRNLTLARVLTGGETDPMGLYLIPTALVVATPTLGCIALAAFVAGGVLALVAPHDLTSRVLGAAAMLQGGLVCGLIVIERAVRDVAGAVQRLADSSSDRLGSAQVADWLAQYDLSSGWLSARLVLLLGGFLLAVVVSRAVVQRRMSAEEERAFDAVDPAPSPQPMDPVVAAVPPSSDFDDSAYSVRPRQSWLSAWAGRYAQYDIASIPPTSRTRFSLTWKGQTGKVRHEPNGPDLVSVGVQSASMFGGSSYEVTDARTGAATGMLVSSGFEWEIRDSSGRTVAEVKAVRTGVGGSVFVATAGQQEVVRFVWGFAGMTAASAELQIEFLPGSEARVHKALAIVLGALLDHQARRASRWHSH